jgi:hypothetical protein
MFKRLRSGSFLFVFAALALWCGVKAAPIVYEEVSPLIGTIVGLGGLFLASAALTLSIIVFAVGSD